MRVRVAAKRRRRCIGPQVVHGFDAGCGPPSHPATQPPRLQVVRRPPSPPPRGPAIGPHASLRRSAGHDLRRAWGEQGHNLHYGFSGY